MPRPISKDELLIQSKKNFSNLFDLIKKLPKEKQEMNFLFEDRDKNIRDVLGHLHEWHLMMLEWYKTGMNNEKQYIPAKGFTWKTTPALNILIWKKYQNIDLETVEKRIGRLEKKAKSGDKEAKAEMSVLEKLKPTLEANKPARSIEFDKEEMLIVKQYTLLTMKPLIYVANLGEEDLEDPMQNPYYVQVLEFAKEEGSDVVPICAKIEAELVGMDKEEKAMFMQDLGIEESGLDKLIKEAYSLLGLRTYFTAGVQEVRAWTFKEGMTAPEMAGIIHSDFQRGFIKAETYSFDDLVKYGSEHALKEAGKIRQEGKQYVGQDGDIMLFKFNV